MGPDDRPAGEARALPRATEVAPGGGEGADTVTLAHADRHRRRCRLATDGGRAVLLDLPQATELRDGDALVLDDGSRVVVRAASEPLMEARARDAHHLARIAWHVGNRHLPAEIRADRLVLPRDHVIAGMLRALGAEIRDVEAPFNPEGGAYGHGRTHGHEHGHGHENHHGHNHATAHGRAHG